MGPQPDASWSTDISKSGGPSTTGAAVACTGRLSARSQLHPRAATVACGGQRAVASRVDTPSMQAPQAGGWRADQPGEQPVLRAEPVRPVRGQEGRLKGEREVNRVAPSCASWPKILNRNIPISGLFGQNFGPTLWNSRLEPAGSGLSTGKLCAAHACGVVGGNAPGPATPPAAPPPSPQRGRPVARQHTR